MSSLIRSNIAGVNWTDGSLHGPGVRESVKSLGQLRGVFHSTRDWQQMDPETVVYRVQWLPVVDEGTEGGLFWGNSTIEPGLVGDEYFMTHGHFHQKTSRGEFYATVQGKGMLLFMDIERNAWAQEMAPGSVHYIPGDAAHRVVNIGSTPLRFIACWPSDAGHDYTSIAEQGFSIRMVCRDGAPMLIRSER